MGAYILVIFQLRTAEHLWIVWRDCKVVENLKITARKYKICHSISKEMPQMLLALFSISLSLKTMLCGPDYEMAN